VDFVVLLSNDVQLLEEMLDNGVPFTTEPNILREMIAPPNIITNVVGSLTGRLNNPFLVLSFLNFFILQYNKLIKTSGNSSVNEMLPDGSLTNIPWRKMGVKYTNNEIFFDITEEIDCIIDR
jgi:AP-3 complex subunit mu